MKKDFVQVARDLGPVISQNIDEEENNGRLSQPVVNALKSAGLYKMLLPNSLGGFENDPPSTAKAVEEIASFNTAAGWSLMVANTSAWWCRYLNEKAIEEIYKKGSDVFVAGAIHPPMQAVRAEGGFRITGRCPLSSNVHEAEHLFVSAMVFEEGKPKIVNGMPEVLGICLGRTDCEIIDTWKTIGMKATDSNDIAVKDAFVPEHFAFTMGPDKESNKYFDGALFRFPAIGINVPTMIAPVALGIASGAIKELKAMAAKKTPMGSTVSMREKGTVQRKLGIAEASVQSSRAYLHQSLSTAWQKTLDGETHSLEEKAGLLLAGVHTVHSCLHAIEQVYAAAGSSAIYLKNKLAHYFTDVQVIRQHGFVNESRYETAGQIYFGLPPDLGVVAF
jgi:alkylation response protein AidB-like acyl-CoA dehydrogenase